MNSDVWCDTLWHACMLPQPLRKHNKEKQEKKAKKKAEAEVRNMYEEADDKNKNEECTG